MKLGFYSPEIGGATVREVFARAKEWGFSTMQYDFSTSHGDTIPEVITDESVAEIADAAKEFGMQIEAINGTLNMIDVNKERREENLRRFPQIAKAAKALDCRIITLCTGSRNPESGWRYHPDSLLPDAWEEMIAVTRRMMETAKEYDLTLGVETEASNVVCTIDRTAKYLEEIGDDHLKVIMDCANLFQAGKAKKENVIPTIDYAFEKLGDQIILAHGKDIQESDGIAFCGAGKGIVDYDHYFSLLKKIDYHDGMIIHGLHSDDDFAVAVPLLKKKAEEAGL